MKENFKALISVILAAVFGGGIAVFGKIGLKEIPPISFTFFRFLIATVCLLPFVIKQKTKIKRNFYQVIFISLLATLNVVLFAYGIRLTTALISQMLYAIVPVMAVIISYLLFKEKVINQKIIGVIIGFIGVLILILLPNLGMLGNNSGSLVGNIIVLFAVVSFSFYTVLSKQLQKDYSPLFTTFIFGLVTALTLMPFFIRDLLVNSNWLMSLSNISILSTLYVGLFGGVGYYLLYQYAIKHGTPLIASMTMYLQPLATFLWAYFLLSERLTLGIIIGGLFALFGAYLVTRKT